MMDKSSGTVFLINIYLQVYMTDLFSMGEKSMAMGICILNLMVWRMCDLVGLTKFRLFSTKIMPNK